MREIGFVAEKVSTEASPDSSESSGGEQDEWNVKEKLSEAVKEVANFGRNNYVCVIFADDIFCGVISEIEENNASEQCDDEW